MASSLEQLLEQLANCRHRSGAERVAHYEEARPKVEASLQQLPLLHGTREWKGFLGALRQGALRSRAARSRAESQANTYLGLVNRVFTSAGVLYPDQDFAFAFSPGAESGVRVEASPWDSGAFCRSLCPHLPPPPHPLRRKLFRENSLHAPDYREYLVHYVASCFQSARDYLVLDPHKWPDPLEALGRSFTSKVFEVRFESRIPLNALTLEAVFVLSLSGGQRSIEMRQALEPLRRQGVPIHPVPGAKNALQWAVRDWVLGRAAT